MQLPMHSHDWDVKKYMLTKEKISANSLTPSKQTILIAISQRTYCAIILGVLNEGVLDALGVLLNQACEEGYWRGLVGPGDVSLVYVAYHSLAGEELIQLVLCEEREWLIKGEVMEDGHGRRKERLNR